MARIIHKYKKLKIKSGGNKMLNNKDIIELKLYLNEYGRAEVIKKDETLKEKIESNIKEIYGVESISEAFEVYKNNKHLLGTKFLGFN